MQALAIALGLILIAGLLKIGGAPYIAFAFGGALIIFLGTKPGARDMLKCVAFGCAFGFIYYLHRGVRIDYIGSTIGTLLGFLGMGAVQVLANRWIWASRADKKQAVLNLGRASAIPSLCVGSMLAVGIAAQLTPETYDPLIFAFDGKFGWPSWTLGALFHAHPWLFFTCGFVYNTLPLALSVCLALQWQHGVKLPVDMGLAALSIGAIGFLLYQFCPVSGPAYLFPNDFPLRLPHVLNVTRIALPPSPRNGMPSLHVAWALLLLWNLRVRRGLLIAATFFLACTVLATLGSGEHYLADLVVSPALVLAIQSACGGVASALRRLSFGVGSAMTVGWLIAFRTGAAQWIPAGQATWVALGLSVLVPAAIAWRASLPRQTSLLDPVSPCETPEVASGVV